MRLARRTVRCLRFVIFVAILALLPVFSAVPVALAQVAPPAEQAPAALPEIIRPVRPWEFLSATGQRAGLYGKEDGNFEAWVYPLKVLKNFHLRFHSQGQVMEASTLARTLIARPDSQTIVYASNSVQVKETLLVPIESPGAILIFDVQGTQSVEIEAVFERDLQFMWPAGLGQSFSGWQPELHSFVMSDTSGKNVGIVGSPSGEVGMQENFSNSAVTSENSIRLGVCPPGACQRLLVIAGSMAGRDEAIHAAKEMAHHWAELLASSADYYRDYLNRTVSLDLPDKQLQQAYDWARVSTIQGMVSNPQLGKGLVAGYRTSAGDGRPGFAWFFGRDSLWTDFALQSAGDYSSAKTALEFVMKFQRADGRVPHEIAQSAGLVDWFKAYPYGWASADATPLLILAVEDYVRQSGDVEFAKAHWDNCWRAYQFLKSTYGPDGFPKNEGVGHGWIEGGPLLPVRSELYQSGIGAEALRALAGLAATVNERKISQELNQEYATQKVKVNAAFWSPEGKFFDYALDTSGKRIDTPSVLTTVPMWFGVLDSDKTDATINVLAGADHQADWGMRIISQKHPEYEPSGYHFGSVWPLFTGWASVGEYRYHRPLPAYANLRANALLALEGSAGHVTEVLSGDFYQTLATGSPHQIWSAAMVISPMLRGMLGLQVDALKGELSFAPHLPARWNSATIRHVRVGASSVDLAIRRNGPLLSLNVTNAGSSPVQVIFSPAVSLRAAVTSATVNRARAHFDLAPSLNDQHVTMQFSAPPGTTSVQIDLAHDFAFDIPASLPALGSTSEGLRVVSEVWNTKHDTLTVTLSGLAGRSYHLPLLDNNHDLEAVTGATITSETSELLPATALVSFGGGSGYVSQSVTFHFASHAAPGVR